MNLTGKRVLVTGGAGFIGSHLVDKLISNDCFIRVVDNLVNGKLEYLKHYEGRKKFDFVLGSITDPSDVARAVEGIDIVFHLACLGVRHSIKHPFENHSVNAEGTLIVLKEALKAKVEKFVYCSSSEVYGTAEYIPMDEKHPLLPCTVYGASKLAGESYTRAYHQTYGMNTLIVRPFNTFGPRSHHEGDAGEMIPKSIVRAINGEDVLVFGDGSQTRDFTYVEDTVEGFVNIVNCDQLIGGTVNLGSGFEISIKSIAEMINSIAGNSAEKIKYTVTRPGDVMRLYADASFLKSVTGWSPKISLMDGLVKTVEWFKSRPEGGSDLLSQEKDINWV